MDLQDLQAGGSILCDPCTVLQIVRFTMEVFWGIVICMVECATVVSCMETKSNVCLAPLSSAIRSFKSSITVGVGGSI
jgi:hypothetical protein